MSWETRLEAKEWFWLALRGICLGLPFLAMAGTLVYLILLVGSCAVDTVRVEAASAKARRQAAETCVQRGGIWSDYKPECVILVLPAQKVE